MTRVTVSIVLFFGVLCVLASLSFATATEHKVKTIIQAMGQADQGHYDAPLAVGGTDEFAEIAHHFNDMVVRIKHSREQEREALVRQKDAEIRSLEAQINPHFLCNTLDAINWVAIEREQMHISKLLNYLAVILRHSIYHSNESVTMAEELAYLDKYVALQRERFCDAFTYHVDVDPSLMGCRIHQLLMPPLIENTIIHGFPGPTGRDRIDLTIRRQDGAHFSSRFGTTERECGGNCRTVQPAAGPGGEWADASGRAQCHGPAEVVLRGRRHVPDGIRRVGNQCDPCHSGNPLNTGARREIHRQDL